MKWILPIAALVMCVAANSRAIELKPTPVQSQFAADLGSRGLQLVAAADNGDAFITDENQEERADRISGRKSTAKAVLYSALVPGLGQYYTGYKTKARYFFAAELVTWVAYGGFRMYGNWKKDDYIDYGNIHANAQLDDKSDDFLDWVGFYTNIDQFNSEGRVGDRERPYLFDTPENHWQWQSVTDQQMYRDLKNMSRESYRRANFMIFVAVLNRVISAIDAAIDVGRVNKTEGVDWQVGSTRFELNLDAVSRDRQFALTVYPGF
jgi:hypothetical protein